MNTSIVWFRRDLRVHDHPSLTAAARDGGRVVPVFVLDDALLAGRFASGPRTRFPYGCLASLRASLRERGADLEILRRRPERGIDHPAPIVDHKEAREPAMARYRAVGGRR